MKGVVQITGEEMEYWNDERAKLGLKPSSRSVVCHITEAYKHPC